MSFVETKTALAVVLLAAGSGAAFSMLRLMGKPGSPAHPMALRRIHSAVKRSSRAAARNAISQRKKSA